MSNKLRLGLSRLFIKLMGRSFSQADWEKFYLLSLHEMNFGNGSDFTSDGELVAVSYIMNKLEKQGPITIFDVGANTGSYAKTLSQLFGDKATIHSFEPSPETFKLLEKTIANIKNVIPNNFGFSDTERQAVLYSADEDSGLSSVYRRKLDHFGIEMNHTESIQLTTIDSYCEKKRIKHIHFLKLDIEGHELSALKGASEKISKKQIDFIQFEFGGCNIDSTTFFRDFYYLLKDNFTIYRILKNGLCELPIYKETFEVFITTNYLAVKK